MILYLLIYKTNDYEAVKTMYTYFNCDPYFM